MNARRNAAGDALRRSIGAQVRRLRESHGMSQEQLATETGISVDVIFGLEQGRHLGVQSLATILDYLDAEVVIHTDYAT